jgi:hypothetical protein
MRTAAILILLATLEAQAQDTGVVAGRAVDSSGAPLAGTQVQLMGYNYRSLQFLGGFSDRPVLHTAHEATVNDRGEYRFIDVPPGKYFLRVPSPMPPRLPLGQVPPLSPLGALFYPGVAGITKAEQIEVLSGEELRIRDLVLTPTPLQPIRIRGGLEPMLYGRPASGEPQYTRFEIDGIRVVRPDEPGDYIVCALKHVFDPDRNMGRALSACKDVVYTGAALEVELTPTTPQGFLTGRVLLDETPPVPFAGVYFGATLLSGWPGNLFATSGPDGSFKSPYPEREGVAILRLLDLPDGYYVSSVRQGSRDALTEGILHSDQDTSLDVRVMRSASVVRGRVPDADRATIVLIPQGDLALRQDKENTHRVATTNPNRTFEIRNVIPGTYRAYAFAKIQEGSHLDAAAFKSFEKLGTPVEIARDGNVSIELKRIP